MKILSPLALRIFAVLSIGLLVLPPSSAMDIMERIVTTQTQSIRREATEYQRKVAEQHARAYMAAQLKALSHAPAKPGKSGGATAKTNETQDLRTLKKKLPRYIAVDTVMDKRSSPGTKKDVMVWDTQSEALVGNYVYDVDNVPAVGAGAKFDTYSAQYVGTGSATKFDTFSTQ
jgi:hypothetical protein